MTEYESLSLFFQLLEAAHAAISNYLTVVFAVVVVTFFAGRKLELSSWLFLLLVYTLFALGMVNEIVSIYLDLVRLGYEIGQVHQPVWFGMAAAAEDGPMYAIPWMVTCMCVLAYLGSIFFFVRVRRASGDHLE